MSTYLKIENGTKSKQYNLTNAYAKPYIKVSNSILPLTTRTTSGIQLKVKDGGATYRAMEYVQSSGSESGTFYSSNVNGQGLSSVTALYTESQYQTYDVRQCIYTYLYEYGFSYGNPEPLTVQQNYRIASYRSKNGYAIRASRYTQTKTSINLDSFYLYGQNNMTWRSYTGGNLHQSGVTKSKYFVHKAYTKSKTETYYYWTETTGYYTPRVATSKAIPQYTTSAYNYHYTTRQCLYGYSGVSSSSSEGTYMTWI